VKKNKRALVISGGGSSLMVIHLALEKIDELQKIYSSITQRTIFSNNPFFVKKKFTVFKL